MAHHVLRRPTAVYRVVDLRDLPVLASGHANADLADLRNDARLQATADEVHRALDVRRSEAVPCASPTSVCDALSDSSDSSGCTRKRVTDSPLRKKSRSRTASFARSLLPTTPALHDAPLSEVASNSNVAAEHLPLLVRTAKCAVARNAASAGARRELHALVCSGEKLSVVRSLSACANAVLAPRFWAWGAPAEGLAEALQNHAPHVMRGRARLDDAFGAAVRSLGHDSTLTKVALSAVVDAREHAIELRDCGRLFAPQTRALSLEAVLAARDRYVASASCEALGEAAVALANTAPALELGAPVSTELRLYPSHGTEPPWRDLRELVVVCCAGSFSLRCAPPAAAKELPQPWEAACASTSTPMRTRWRRWTGRAMPSIIMWTRAT